MRLNLARSPQPEFSRAYRSGWGGRGRGPAGRPGPVRVGATFLLVLLLLAGSGWGAQTLLHTVWDRVVGYQTPYTQALGPTGLAVGSLSPSVVLVVIDGLRVDTSRQMPVLSALRQGAVNLVALAEQPSLSLPGAATIGTGTKPYVHGVTTNWYEGPIAVDSIFASLDRAGVGTRFVGWDGWKQLYQEHLDLVVTPEADKDAVGPHDAAVRDRARELLLAAAGPPPGLTVIYFSGTDIMGHRHGGVSPQYLAEVLRVDNYLGELLALLDLTQTTVIVTSDHGHVDAGGHGGWEPIVLETPLVLAGRGIAGPADGAPGSAAGQWPQVYQMDIAPTIASLLGADPPAHALGLHLGTWLRGDLAWQAGREVVAATARAQLSPLLTGIGRGAEPSLPALVTQARESLEAGDFVRAQERAREFLRLEAAERQRVQAAARARERAARLPAAALLALAPLAVLVLMAKPPRLWAPVAATALFFLLFYGVYAWARGLTYSFSAFNSEAQVRSFINLRLMEGAAWMVAAALVGGLLSRDLDFGPRTSSGLGALATAFLVMWGLGLQVLLYFYGQGFYYPNYLPDLRAGFKCLVYLLTASGAGLAAAPAVALATLAGGLGTSRRMAWKGAPSPGWTMRPRP